MTTTETANSWAGGSWARFRCPCGYLWETLTTETLDPDSVTCPMCRKLGARAVTESVANVLNGG